MLRSDVAKFEIGCSSEGKPGFYESVQRGQNKIRGTTLSQENFGAYLPLWTGPELPELITSKLRHTVK